ncbi:MAG: flippase-like domain-containing protein [Dehalococcoidia bacterium]|uniref:lysylphosphatidylglycerol synthase transmembrane domain-containing protein n=1 Tax=Candidatus Amarobacter glycogenicus TaxID=3140699 RepID=UPI0031353D1C|nr:flippase-like domain-containing protein [Dehalococcoidia bacterium]MBK6560154.1 flippase-like domain-containing protein [Dehalococcoidia bacterium]MBK7125755.1 flippase-like domain-containing protein [Dehalococcoidia bacterium]MBK9342389.1 flippase-like domain-containing protein [Dehalococcoidia bacterium]MBK9545750.1 flippase-like domain-containing protein [Dehalococcoidia bacterium]
MLRSVRFWASFAISAVLIALFLRATHPSELADAFGEADYRWLIPGTAVLFVAICARCVRWSVLMRPVAPMSPQRLFPYAIIGYMANNLLPARAGEVVRAFVLGDRENVSRMGTFGTIAVERLFDGCTLVLMLLIAGSVVGFEDSRLRAIAWVSTAFFVAALVAFYVLTLDEERAKRVTHYFLRILPDRFEHIATDLADNLVSSLRSVHDPRSLFLVALFSGLAWTIEAGAYAVIGQGFDLNVTFAHYCLLLSAANLAIIIPTFFGGTGPFEWAAKLVLVGADVSDNVAGAYSIVAHAVILIPTTILGLILLWSFGVSFRRITHVETERVTQR